MCSTTQNMSAIPVCALEDPPDIKVSMGCYPAGLDRVRASTRFVVNAVAADVDTSKSPKSQGFTMPGACSRPLCIVEAFIPSLSTCYCCSC